MTASDLYDPCMTRLTSTVRRWFAALSVVLSTGLVFLVTAGPASAQADDYVPTTITKTTQTVITTVPPTPTPLPNTGAGFNLGLTVGAAALVLVLGVALCWFGYRRSRHAQH